MNGPFWIRLGAIFAGLAVATGAFAAHGLRERLSPRILEVFETGAQYQMYHSIALIFVGLSSMYVRSTALTVAGTSFVIGILHFSGSLFALALSGVTRLGMITPIGGVAFLVGWSALAIASWDRMVK